MTQSSALTWPQYPKCPACDAVVLLTALLYQGEQGTGTDHLRFMEEYKYFAAMTVTLHDAACAGDSHVFNSSVEELAANLGVAVDTSCSRSMSAGNSRSITVDGRILPVDKARGRCECDSRRGHDKFHRQ